MSTATTQTVENWNPAVCPEPGIYRGVLAEAYHSWRAVSPSSAKPALKSALNYLESLRTTREETDAMRLGTLCHAAVMEPDTMLRRFACWDEGTRRGKSWDAFCLANAGKTIVTAAQVDIASKVRDRANKHPAIRAIMRTVTDIEVSVRWDYSCRKSDHLVLCKGRPDMLCPGRIPDIKTTNDLDDQRRTYRIKDFGHDVSMAAYRYGLHEHEAEFREPVLIWIETNPPYDAMVCPLDEEWIKRGQAYWLDAIETIAVAEATNEYPGRSDIEVPEIMPEHLAYGRHGKLALTLDGDAVEME